MKTLFIATSNKGKQAEIAAYAAQYGKGIAIQFPDAATEIAVEETGTSFEENAFLKAQAYQVALDNPALIYVGDDSGIKIHALDDQPGVFTRRWAGYEMTDQEILDYCLDTMKDIPKQDRGAAFETVLAVIKPGNPPRYLTGKLSGHILETPLTAESQPGLPFRSIFWVDEADCPIYELHSASETKHGTILTHREKAFKQLFESI